MSFASPQRIQSRVPVSQLILVTAEIADEFAALLPSTAAAVTEPVSFSTNSKAGSAVQVPPVIVVVSRLNSNASRSGTPADAPVRHCSITPARLSVEIVCPVLFRNEAPGWTHPRENRMYFPNFPQHRHC